MNKKVTIQDIADALGISRNTVSKAINNADGIADSTREKIIQKAIEMEYKQFSYVSSLMNVTSHKASSEKSAGIINLFITEYLSYSNINSLVMDRIYDELSQIGYSLIVCRVRKENIRMLTLPQPFNKEKCAGIICVEVFDPDYSDMLSNLGIPLLFLDGPARRGGRSVNADLLLTENCSEIITYIQTLIKNGLTRIGFIGNYDHCQSFWERYIAFRMAMRAAGIPIDERYIIKTKDRSVEEMADSLEAIEELPDAFICANDFVAIDAMHLLAQKEGKIPDHLHILGFDDSHESRFFFPSFSSIHIHSQEMAYAAMHLLISRIEEPAMNYRTIYVATDLVPRGIDESLFGE